MQDQSIDLLGPNQELPSPLTAPKRIKRKPSPIAPVYDVDAAIRLNEAAIQSALFGRASDSIQQFNLALTKLGEFPSIQHSLRFIARSYNDRSTTSCQRSGLDNRLEYDEGWDAFSSFVFLDCLASTASRTELAVAILYNAGQLLLVSQQIPEAQEALLQAYSLSKSSQIKSSHSLEVPLLHKIAYIQYLERRFETSIDSLKQALDASFDHDMPAAAILNCLGVLYFHLPTPKVTDALDCLVRSLAIQRRSNDQRAIATTLNNLGRVYFIAQELDLATASYEEALRIRRSTLGEDHPDVAATLYNLGQTLHQQGELRLALKHYEAFLRISSKQRPHRYSVIVLKCMALIYHELKAYQEALKFYQQALSLGRVCLGVHSDVASILNKLGNLYYEMGDIELAMQTYQQGLAVERLVLPANHPNIAVSLSNIGQIAKQRGDLTTALRFYREVLEIQEKSGDAIDATMAVTLSNIGLLHYQARNYKAALSMYERALRIRRDLGGEETLDFAACLNSIGLVLFKLGAYETALARFLDSLSLRRRLQGEYHQDIAVILYNVATIYSELGNEDEAIRCYERTLSIERKTLGPLHSDVISTLRCLANVFQQRGDVDSALEYYTQVLRLQRRQCAGNELSIAQTLGIIGNLHIQRGAISEAMEYISQATRIIVAKGGDVGEVDIFGLHLYGFYKLHPAAAAAA